MEGNDNLFDEISFNDADGSDADILPYDYSGTRDYSSNNDWDEPLFYTSGNDWSNSITYDCIKEDIRYTVVINYGRSDNNDKHITIFYGKSYREGPDRPIQKEIKMVGPQYGMDYFVNYIIDEIHVESSIEKFLKIMKKFTTLKAFL